MKSKFIIICSIYILFSSCGNDGRGYEYMPNMYRSPSLETYGENNLFTDSLNAREPVKGTIARGKLTTFNYDGTLAGYLKAGEEANNPFDNTEQNLEEGKKIQSTMMVLQWAAVFMLTQGCLLVKNLWSL